MSNETAAGSKCETCDLRLRAERNPRAVLSLLWRFHTLFCPGWKAYQRELAQRKLAE